MLVLTHRPRIFGLGSSFLTLYPWLLGLGWFGLSGLGFLALALLVLALILVLVPSVAFVAEMAVLLG